MALEDAVGKNGTRPSLFGRSMPSSEKKKSRESPALIEKRKSLAKTPTINYQSPTLSTQLKQRSPKRRTSSRIAGFQEMESSTKKRPRSSRSLTASPSSASDVNSVLSFVLNEVIVAVSPPASSKSPESPALDGVRRLMKSPKETTSPKVEWVNWIAPNNWGWSVFSWLDSRNWWGVRRKPRGNRLICLGLKSYWNQEGNPTQIKSDNCFVCKQSDPSFSWLLGDRRQRTLLVNPCAFLLRVGY